tara:strand:+ start:1227 stop:1499 length:273 start_codon:yes stop_codon:yes gene_type:complete
MGLTTKKLQSQLATNEIPHYFVVKRGHDWQRHCGTMKDVECILSIYPDATVTQVFPPNPTTVDVRHTTIKDPELPEQKILPESEAIPLDL